MEAITPPRQRRKEARPAELMAAALELFVEKGFVGTRLEDVAARAGVSKGTLYLYFDSKEALFKAVIQEGIVPILEQGDGALRRRTFKGSAADLLARPDQRMVAAHRQHPPGRRAQADDQRGGQFPRAGEFTITTR